MTPILAAFFEFSSTALWMSVAGLTLLVIGLEDLNYFADTLLFGGTIPSLAYATTASD